jgi:hypothetical protein
MNLLYNNKLILNLGSLFELNLESMKAFQTVQCGALVPLLVLALLGGLYFWWRRQRKSKTEYTSHELSSAPPKWYSASSELPPTEVKRNEMSDVREPAELPANGG